MRPPRERESLVDSLTVRPLQFAGGGLILASSHIATS
jgi:hypothetical protein